MQLDMQSIKTLVSHVETPPTSTSPTLEQSQHADELVATALTLPGIAHDQHTTQALCQ